MNRGIKLIDLISYTLLLLCLATKMCSADGDFDGLKQKRAGGSSVGLFPFPRVGRSDPDLLPEWESPNSYNSFENYDDLGRHEMKRQGLVAFPRVGRSGINPKFFHQQMAEYNKRGLSGASPSSAHMWFGPRLGKRYAHDQAENTIFVPRLGRSSDDFYYQHPLESPLSTEATSQTIANN